MESKFPKNPQNAQQLDRVKVKVEERNSEEWKPIESLCVNCESCGLPVPIQQVDAQGNQLNL